MRLIQKSNLKAVLISGLFLLGLMTPVFVASSTSALTFPVKTIAADDAGGNGGGKNKGGKVSKDPALSKKVCTKDNCPIVSRYINPFITMLAGLVGIVAVIAIIIGGIEFSSAGGDPQKAANGKRHIRNAIVGLVAFVFFWAFMQWVIPGGIGQ